MNELQELEEKLAGSIIELARKYGTTNHPEIADARSKLYDVQRKIVLAFPPFPELKPVDGVNT